MRAHRLSEERLKRIFALALCIAGAALLSACETERDARETYRNTYSTPVPATYYTVIVHDGDSVSAIAARYSTSSGEVMRMNNLSSGDTIHPGEELRIPANGATRRTVLREATNNRLAPAPAYSPDQKIVVREAPPVSQPRRTAYTSLPQHASSTSVETRSGDALISGFVVPVSGTIVSTFGASSSGERNDGINIAAAAGTPIRAAADGVVTYAGNELKSYGNLILIKHGDEYVTAYAHTNSIGVARGQRVSKGDIIGTVGQTGDVDRPQLHFEIRRGMKPIDPRPLLVAAS